MRKNLSRMGGKKIAYDACKRSTVFWQRIFLQELQNGHKDVQGFTFLDNITAIIQKSFYGDQIQPLRRDFVLLYYI